MKNKVIQTKDSREWLVINEVNFENTDYLLVVGVDTNDDTVSEELRVVKKYEEMGKTYIDMETNEEVLLKVCPLLEENL